jgi:hypothetical protein
MRNVSVGGGREQAKFQLAPEISKGFTMNNRFLPRNNNDTPIPTHLELIRLDELDDGEFTVPPTNEADDNNESDEVESEPPELPGSK